MRVFSVVINKETKLDFQAAFRILVHKEHRTIPETACESATLLMELEFIILSFSVIES